MGDRPQRTRATVVGLAVAVACAGLAGYLISRPSRPAPEVTVPSIPQSFQPPATLPAVTPQPIASGFAAADDPATGQVVVFGGSSGLGADTWVWTGLTWEFEEPSTQPPPLWNASLVYDPVLRMVMLAGGGPLDTDGNDGTWGWDGRSWRLLDSNTSQPSVASGTMAWDPPLQQMILVTAASTSSASGSQTWVWDDSRWVPKGGIAPFQDADLQIAFDESTNTLIAVSCCADVRPPASGGVSQTWRWDGSQWRLLGATAIPWSTYFNGVSWDPITHSVLISGELFSGSQTPQLTPARMWKLAGHHWTALGGAGPQVLSAALIETNDGLRLIGSDATVEGISSPYHIWAWTGSSWKQLD
jgi:hypothetical protein